MELQDWNICLLPPWRFSDANAGQLSTGSRGCPSPGCWGLLKLSKLYPQSRRYRINI